MQKPTKLVLLVNLGSPHELSVGAIRSFLRQFLADKRVVGLPRLLWYPILFGIILPLRARKLVHKYRQIWLEKSGSPLIYYTAKQAELLARYITEPNIMVDYAFCYGSSVKRDRSISARLKYWHQAQTFSELIILPLYPQYSSSTTGAVLDLVSQHYSTAYYIPTLKFINSFATHPIYIKALANSVKKFWVINGQSTRLLISFHSVPSKLIANGDSYLSECQETYHLLCDELGINAETDAKLVFQSKFGKAKWLEPATDQTLLVLATSGVESVDVICPGFVSDCLETLEEIALQNRELFIQAGGKHLGYIPCLNDGEDLTVLLHSLLQNRS